MHIQIPRELDCTSVDRVRFKDAGLATIERRRTAWAAHKSRLDANIRASPFPQLALLKPALISSFSTV